MKSIPMRGGSFTGMRMEHMTGARINHVPTRLKELACFSRFGLGWHAQIGKLNPDEHQSIIVRERVSFWIYDKPRVRFYVLLILGQGSGTRIDIFAIRQMCYDHTRQFRRVLVIDQHDPPRMPKRHHNRPVVLVKGCGLGLPWLFDVIDALERLGVEGLGELIPVGMLSIMRGIYPDKSRSFFALPLIRRARRTLRNGEPQAKQTKRKHTKS